MCRDFSSRRLKIFLHFLQNRLLGGLEEGSWFEVTAGVVLVDWVEFEGG